MKLERSTKNYVSGNGKTTYESDYFRVTVWYMDEGTRTELECNLLNFNEIYFDGEHEFTSDEECIEQFNFSEILKIIKHQKEASYIQGKEDKILEIKKCLGINNDYGDDYY